MKCYECKSLGIMRPDAKVYCRAKERSFPDEAECCLTAKEAEELYGVTRYRFNQLKVALIDKKELLDGLYDWRLQEIKREEGIEKAPADVPVEQEPKENNSSPL